MKIIISSWAFCIGRTYLYNANDVAICRNYLIIKYVWIISLLNEFDLARREDTYLKMIRLIRRR